MKRIAAISVAAALAVVGFAPAAQAATAPTGSGCPTVIFIPLC